MLCDVAAFSFANLDHWSILVKEMSSRRAILKKMASLSTQRIPRGRDTISSTQRNPGCRDTISCTQRNPGGPDPILSTQRNPGG